MPGFPARACANFADMHTEFMCPDTMFVRSVNLGYTVLMRPNRSKQSDQYTYIFRLSTVALIFYNILYKKLIF